MSGITINADGISCSTTQLNLTNVNLIGISNAPTAAVGTNDTQIATTGFVNNTVNTIPTPIPMPTYFNIGYISTRNDVNDGYNIYNIPDQKNKITKYGLYKIRISFNVTDTTDAKAQSFYMSFQQYIPDEPINVLYGDYLNKDYGEYMISNYTSNYDNDSNVQLSGLGNINNYKNRDFRCYVGAWGIINMEIYIVIIPYYVYNITIKSSATLSGFITGDFTLLKTL